MSKILIATCVYNSLEITNQCFLPSLYKQCNSSKFDLVILNTGILEKYSGPDINNLTVVDLTNNGQKAISHAEALQYIISQTQDQGQYEQIIICENDTIILNDLLSLCNDKSFLAAEFETKFQYSLLSDFNIGIQRYLPMLFRINFNHCNIPIIYQSNDVSIKFSIPSLNIQKDIKNSYFADPGWYFYLWVKQNKLSTIDIKIDKYIKHFWFGSKGRKSKSNPDYEKTYYQKLNAFILDNKKFLI